MARVLSAIAILMIGIILVDKAIAGPFDNFFSNFGKIWSSSTDNGDEYTSDEEDPIPIQNKFLSVFPELVWPGRSDEPDTVRSKLRNNALKPEEVAEILLGAKDYRQLVVTSGHKVHHYLALLDRESNDCYEDDSVYVGLKNAANAAGLMSLARYVWHCKDVNEILCDSHNAHDNSENKFLSVFRKLVWPGGNDDHDTLRSKLSDNALKPKEVAELLLGAKDYRQQVDTSGHKVHHYLALLDRDLYDCNGDKLVYKGLRDAAEYAGLKSLAKYVWRCKNEMAKLCFANRL